MKRCITMLLSGLLLAVASTATAGATTSKSSYFDQQVGSDPQLSVLPPESRGQRVFFVRLAPTKHTLIPVSGVTPHS